MKRQKDGIVVRTLRRKGLDGDCELLPLALSMLDSSMCGLEV